MDLQRALYSYYDEVLLRCVPEEARTRDADDAAKVLGLYRAIHLHGTVAEDELAAREDEALVDELCRPYLAWRRWRSRWRLVGRKGGRAVLQRNDGMLISAPESCCRPVSGKRSSSEGEYEVALTALRRRALPGWVVLDGAPPNSVPLDGRVYISLSPDGLEDGWHTLMAALRGSGVLYQAKVVNNRDAARRPDCCVVYVPRSSVPEVASLVDQVLPHDVRDELTPGFALPESRGVAVALAPADRPLASHGLTCAEEIWMAIREEVPGPCTKATAWRHLQALLERQRVRLDGRPESLEVEARRV
ncbi:hypothetical protein RxyAA322_13010 [Rubrobacter xylanophilus]|uniref:Uncharacterized protein n=2 Tax=Rubrobacter xylanophilus TaxID=49319 RepID=A0A510HLZ6_9ACTN|nr:hypothetical protein RxyAA322_13010 [Rubrobacter xylanophilus]